MTYQEIQQQVTETVWSEELRRESARQGIVYRPMQLLRIVMDAVHDAQQRQTIYALLAENLPEIAVHARKQAAREQEKLTWHCQGGPEIVYGLSAISRRCSEPPAEILCASWEAALSQTARYREFCRPFFREDGLRFTITRRRLLQADEDWAQEAEGWCNLDDEMRVQRVDRWREEECTGDCDDCAETCVYHETALYPAYLSPWDFVRYRWNGWVNYAVC